jgi:hypothetical protein
MTYRISNNISKKINICKQIITNVYFLYNEKKMFDIPPYSEIYVLSHFVIYFSIDYFLSRNYNDNKIKFPFEKSS